MGEHFCQSGKKDGNVNYARSISMPKLSIILTKKTVKNNWNSTDDE
jgi:hypothetical protein